MTKLKSFNSKVSKGMKLAGHIVKSYVDNKSAWKISRYFSVAKNLGYYATHLYRVESDGLYNTLDPQLERLDTLWNLTEHPMVSKVTSVIHPKVGHDEIIYVPKMFPRITRELILKEHSEGTSNQSQPLNIIVQTAKEIENQRADILKELFIKGSDKIPVRIFAAEPLNLRDDTAKKPKPNSDGETLFNDEVAIVIYIHGGGFIAQSTLSHKAYLGTWVNDLKVIFFGIDYSLAPKNPYPAGLDDCWQAYLWIINYAETVLSTF